MIICTNLQEETQTQLAALFQKINLAASVLIKTVGGNVLQDKTDSALGCAVWGGGGGRWGMVAPVPFVGLFLAVLVCSN